MRRIDADMKMVRVALDILSGKKPNTEPMGIVAIKAIAAWERVDRTLYDHITEATVRHIINEQSRKAVRQKL